MLSAFDVPIILHWHCPVFKFPPLFLFDPFIGGNIFQPSDKGQSLNKIHLFISVYPVLFIIKHHTDLIAFV